MTNVRGRRLLALAASLIALLTVTGTAAAQTQGSSSFTLTLLHANDGESELLELIRAGGAYGGAPAPRPSWTSSAWRRASATTPSRA